MQDLSYQARRRELTDYFDCTAVDAWAQLTSDAPVSRIRATVRAGRDQMRATLLDWLPADLSGARVLDAGCGTGALSVEAARRGADVVAVDLSPKLIEIGRDRLPTDLGTGSVDLRVGDMLSVDSGDLDYVVAMDSLIHYRVKDAVEVLAALAPRVRHGMLFTFIPSTPLLGLMHATGRLFPRGNRAPDIQPVRQRALLRQLSGNANLADWRPARHRRIKSGFYISQGVELVRDARMGSAEKGERQ